MSTLDDIKKALDQGKAIIGTNRVMKYLKLGKLKSVYISSNAPEDVVKDVKHYAQLSGVSVVPVAYPNDELGVVCKKSFSISILGISQ